MNTHTTAPRRRPTAASRNPLFIPRSLERPAPWLVALFVSITLQAASWAETVNFDGLGSGTLLTTQLQGSQGIAFPQGVEVLSSAAARSGGNVGVTQFNGEFARDSFEATFTGGQEDVALYVRREPGQTSANAATLRAYNSSGGQIDSDTVSLSSGTVWYRLAAQSGSGAIRRIVVTATEGVFTTNFIIVDDLQFTEPGPPPPTDTTPPALTINSPSPGAVITNSFVAISVSASDGTQLSTIAGTVEHLGSGTEIGAMDYCGSVFSGVCANPYSGSRNISLDPAFTGAHRIRVEACDGSANCTSRQRDFVYNPPAPPAEVTIGWVEINQGVQTGLARIEGPGSVRSAGAAVRLQGGRDTLVRFYPFSIGADRAAYTGRMWVEIQYQDGTNLVRRLLPNTGASSVAVMEQPASSAAQGAALREMRRDAAKTLNFVIPGDLLEDADQFDVRFEEGSPLTGKLQVGLSPEVRLAVKNVRLFGPGIPGSGAYPNNAQLDEIFEHLEAVYPVSEVVRLNSGSWVIMRDLFCEAFAGIFTDGQLACALWQFQRHTPSTPIPFTEDPIYDVVVGYVPYSSFSRVGMAMNRHSLAYGWSDVGYAHEIGHNAGRPHAGGAHGEAGGETWPHPHGLMGANNFGAVMTQTSSGGGIGFGEWQINIVDPCPVAPAAAGSDCAAPAEGVGTHDFMSYGDSSSDLGPLNDRSRDQNWISDRNWNRIYNQIQVHGRRASSLEALPEAIRNTGVFTQNHQAMAMRIDGIVAPDGSIVMLPVLRESVPLSELQQLSASIDSSEALEADFELKLYDADGSLLQQRDFVPTEIFDGAEEQVFMLDQVVPFEPQLHRVDVLKDGVVAASVEASSAPPTVEVLSPNGGEVFESGKVTLTWTRSDPDGDGVVSQIQVSPDNGVTWQDLGMVGRDEPARLTFNVAELPTTDQARFRVLVTDGVLTSADSSDCSFALNVGEAAECTVAPPPPTQNCVPTATNLCLNGGRFKVEMDWQIPDGTSGKGRAVPLEGGDSGYFWFFDDQNVEALVKVLDACVVNDFNWVFSAGLTDVKTTLTVTDTETDEVKIYSTPQGQLYPTVTDNRAFAVCGDGARVASEREQTDAAGASFALPRSRREAAEEPSTSLSLTNDRFEVTTQWSTKNGNNGDGFAIPLTDDTGYFWFFAEENAEVVVKLLDACSFVDSFWLFASGLTDVEVTLRIRDKQTDEELVYSNALGKKFAPIRNNKAFKPCSG